MGQLGEWPAWYTHRRNMNMEQMWRNPDTGNMVSQLHEYPAQSSLRIGEWGIWEMSATSEHGQFSLGPRHKSSLDNPELSQETLSTASLLEGTPKSIELTKYERNPAARRKCIDHFGPTCLACGLNYQQNTVLLEWG